jgi:hypothetical protein
MLRVTVHLSYQMDNTYLLTYLLTYSLTPWRRILFEKLIVTQLVKKYFLMEPEGSLPCSQKTATVPLSLRFILMLSSSNGQCPQKKFPVM